MDTPGLTRADLSPNMKQIVGFLPPAGPPTPIVGKGVRPVSLVLGSASPFPASGGLLAN